MVPVLTFDELDSTNAEARRRAEAGERGPVWLMARRQTAGVGRRGRVWDGGQGNLTATLLMTLADKTPVEAAQLAFVAGLAAWTAITVYVPAAVVTLKWPNDVLIEGRKACGVLIESGPAAGGTWAAVGVGLNLATYPEAVERPATALADHLSHDMIRAPSPDEAIAILAETFDVTLALWLAQGFAPIRQAWTERALGFGGPCAARLERERVTGVAEGLDADGALLLRLPGNELRRITAGDVFFGAP
jgi:BirA family biotin operon repressor/biotin-[acetyl-CoA-carboxylase] ligase